MHAPVFDFRTLYEKRVRKVNGRAKQKLEELAWMQGTFL